MNNPYVDLRPLIFSEQCVIVSGAGTPEVNGTYLYAGQYNSHPVFYKNKNAVLYWDGASWVLGSNGDDQYFGTATTHPWQATWTRGEGSLPTPSVRQGTVHDFEREIGKRNDPTLRGSAAEKNVGPGPDDVAAGDHTHTTSDIASASVYFDIADSHPSVNGSYDVWDIDANGRFRWANLNAAAEGATWTALRWNSNRWELGTYTAFTTWTALYFNPSTAVIPPATGWQAVPGNTQPIPTLQWLSQPTADEITSLHAEDSRLQKQLDDQGGITAAIQTLSTETAAALATKAPLSHKHAGDDVYLSAADEHGPVLLNGFNAGDGIYWPSNTSINASPVYLRRGGSGSTFGLFYQNDAWHQYFGAPASILESSDPDGANFPWEAAWNHDVTRATAYDFHRHILEQLQFAGAPRPLAEVTGLQTALDGKASAADLATLESSLGTLSQQNADAAAITGGSANFDTLEAGTAHAALAGTLTISATGDILGSGTNRLLGFIAGGATY